MDPTRFQRIEAIFHDTADLAPGPARDAAVLAGCGGDLALAADVRALLDQEARLGADAGGADPHLGLRLGSYEVTALIARGGMAAVYEARRADDHFQQRVAIKIMDLRLSDPALVAQFLAERQILAGLEHPALTRLLDGGVTALGEPYLVMEFVEGQAIDRYCDEQRLDVPARLRLFAAVCDGVAFAHRNLVLHRDLKPSNILVTREGRAKIVDFGTAALLSPDRLSTVSAAPLTPAYASPEQLTGKPVGTASDQYSLGVVLYELLTGAAPFGDRPSLLSAIERTLAGTTTTAPHAAVTDAAAATRQTSLARLRRLLAQDLGTIVTKALASDPAARYASVQHLSDDLTRWTAAEPILARPPSVTYRTSRFVRRHWAASIIAATLTLSLAAATAVSAQQARIARVESGKAQQLNRFLTDMLASASPAFGATRAGALTVKELLDKASPLVSQTLSASPDVEAEMLRVIGATYTGIGAAAEAEPYLRRAAAQFHHLADDVGAARVDLDLGSCLVAQGRYRDAEQVLRAARAVVVARPAAFDARSRLASANFLALSRTYQKAGDAEALALYRETLASADADAQSVLAVTAAHNLGLQLVLAGELDEAERWLREAERRWRAIGTDIADRFAVNRSMSELMRTVGNYPEAVREGQLAVDGWGKTLPAGHPFHAAAKTTLGRALVLNGQVDEGERVLNEAMDLFLKVRPKGHVEMTGTQMGLGAAYRRQGRLDLSERVLREAQAALAVAPRQVKAGVLGELGLTLRARGQTGESQTLLQESHDIFVSYLPATHPYVRMAKARLEGATQ